MASSSFTLPKTTQIQRLCQRDGLDQAEALRRIDAQLSHQERAKHATWIIDNGFLPMRPQNAKSNGSLMTSTSPKSESPKPSIRRWVDAELEKT